MEDLAAASAGVRAARDKPAHRIGWGTNGTAAIVREASRRLQLRFSSSFQTQAAPELFVYLAKYEGGRRTEWTQVAPLRRA